MKDDVFLDRLNILTHHRRIRLNENGEIVRGNSLDIVSNNVAVRSDLATDAFEVRLTQGVADTVAEAYLVSGCMECGDVENVSELWASTQVSDIPWVPIHKLDETALKNVVLGNDARGRVESDLRAGYAVLVPTHSVANEEVRAWVGGA